MPKYNSSTDEVECITQACPNNSEKLELDIQVNNRSWQLEKTYFHCRVNPIVDRWSPKKSILRYEEHN